MKTWHLFISIVVILALVCSPALAISKADLISQYKGQSSPTILPPVPTPSHIPSWYITPAPTPVWGPVIPFPTPSPVPTRVPTGSGTGTLLITSDPLGANVYLDGEYKGVTPLGYVVVFAGSDPDNIFILTGIPVGQHQVTFTKEGYKDYTTSVTLKNGEYKYVPAILVQVSPDPTPTVIPTIIPSPTPTPAPSHTPCPPGMPYCSVFW